MEIQSRFQLYQLYAEPFELPAIKLLILHISEHRDEAVVKPIWNTIFHQATGEGTADQQADKIASSVVSFGRRFYPSDSAFPLRESHWTAFCNQTDVKLYGL